MNFYKYLAQYLQRSSLSCAVIYFFVLLFLLTTCWFLIANLQHQRATLVSARELLDQLQKRSASHANGGINVEKNITQGSPFLEGRTVTVAGAELLQRVSQAITNAGGRVVSSQVNLQTAPSNSGLISVAISCEIDETDLQKLLFDLEAGMPFLFINELEIQASDLSINSRTGFVRVLLTASGQWLDKK